MVHSARDPASTTKNAASSQGRGQRSWYHLASAIGAPNHSATDHPSPAITDCARSSLLAACRRFGRSTPEPRSRDVSEEGSHPMTLTRWRTVTLYFARSKSLHYVVDVDYTVRLGRASRAGRSAAVHQMIAPKRSHRAFADPDGSISGQCGYPPLAKCVVLDGSRTTARRHRANRRHQVSKGRT